QLSLIARLLRNRDALHDALHARGGARLPRSQPGAAGIFLCAAAIAATVQADSDDLGLRQILSDCALLPRRRSASRPPARIYPDRSGDVLSATRACLGGRRRLSFC